MFHLPDSLGAGGVAGGWDAQPLPDSGHQNHSLSAFFLAHATVLDKKEDKHGPVHPNLGPHPNLPGHVNTVSCTTKTRIWHLPEWGI